MDRRRFLLLGSAAATLAAAPAGAGLPARQLSFRRRPANGAIEFSYSLLDFFGRKQSIAFALPVDVVQAARRQIVFSETAISRHVEAALRDAALQQSLDISIRFDRRADGFGWSIEGRSDQVEAAMTALKSEERRAVEDYLARNFLASDGNLVSPDYARLVAHYHPILEPAAQAIAAAEMAGGTAGRLDLALALIQTIPYDELRTRDVESGFDFVTPPTLLETNKGDCDSKAVALASILRSLLPAARMIMVLLPRHAVLGIDLPARGGDRTLRHDGRQYLLMEAAGPAPYRVGALFPASEAEIVAGRVERIVTLGAQFSRRGD
ncbi:MAG: hypothetical protein AB7F36_09935 [Reyranellaceae bacterium]